MTLYKWSRTAANNSNADSTINWAENQAPSSVNDSSRAEMAAVAKYRDDMSGNIETAGTSTAYTITTYQVTTTLTDGFSVTARLHTANGASPTLNVDATGAKAIRAYNSTAIPTGALGEDSVHTFVYDSGDDCWYIHGFFITTTLALTGLQISGGTELTAPAVGDELPIYDLSATANRRITLTNFFKVLTGLTAETDPAVDDELMLYDLSATTTDKITLLNMLKVINGLTADATPDRELDYFVTYDASASLPKKVLMKNAVTPGTLICIVEDNQAQNTDGASLVENADTVRTLNTLVYNRNSMASVASNRLTLPAGIWEIEWYAPVGGGSDNVVHQSFLYNQTDGAEVKRGTGGLADAGDTVSDITFLSVGSTVVTIASAKAFEIRHRTANNGTIQGNAANLGTEVYTRVIVRAA